MFEIQKVSKQYNGEFALNNISLTMGKGMNFIVGASGSGKTTLLKIISGMDQDFDGEVTYCGKNIKELTTSEKSYFYNNIFGFVWQDFNLLEDLSVLENVLLPQYLKNKQNQKNANNILKELKIFDLAQRKVNSLSGGQKQRVAIARELMKNPKVIIADEPTSALDEKNSETTMDILKSISKNRTVIVVTHDVNLIDSDSNIIDLDEGKFVASPQKNVTKIEKLTYGESHRLTIKNAFSMTKSNVKSKFGRFLVSVLSLMIAGVLLLTTVSGTIASSGQGDIEKLLSTYGDALKDISIVSSFTSAVGTDDNQEEKPNADVSQDIGGLYDQYVGDERVDFTAFLQAFDNIKVTVDGKEYPIEGTGTVPSINKLIAGKMPTGKDNEVVVPDSFVKSMGISNEQAIGKEIDFSSAIYNWDTGDPVIKNASITAKIVGVADNTTYMELEGNVEEFTIGDSFFFSKTGLDDLRGQAGIENEAMDFLIRAKTPTDMIAIKDELNEKGIAPLGQFELVEDIVRLNDQTTEQSGSASMFIGILAVVMVMAISLITGFMRKREFAIYKVSGFNNVHFSLLNLTEKITEIMTAILLMLVTSPLINIATKGLFSASILNSKMLISGVQFIALVGVAAYLTTAIAFIMTKTSTALKTGDR
ncbi:ABC-type lipoprotein export system, ATPase component [Psychrobacillus psychrotolerans]|uniref:ABC-type lipoprotein export system, ATPase component n=1 Tax=Psychrobacillus psychrotolerans TaxID=126156 RepID=A0A1I5VC46_9BACI|nr:ABC transporter ATP-binding protein [Psychrobacillus psychrotolerans]SFQ05079.1 ABC-type lipoprotein export system, ATPase component [Psychrobacillus psychrotolerans]